jgi:hypothetical protein
VSLQTSYEFTLPRGYVDHHGELHRTGTMRLATARDELEPLRDPTISGPDDPRLTILVLARVVETLGELTVVNDHVIGGLFAADLAYLQDFYGVINFGTQEEFDALTRSQSQTRLIGAEAAGAASPPAREEAEPTPDADEPRSARPNLRAAVEELPRAAQ